MLEAFLRIDDVELPLGHGLLSSLVSNLIQHEDRYCRHPHWSELLDLLSFSTDPEVLSQVVQARDLGRDRVGELLQSAGAEMVRGYLYSDRPLAWIPTPVLIRWLHDPQASLHETLAEQALEFKGEARTLVLDILSDSRNPAIRKLLAEQTELPGSYLSRLAKDPDFEVAEAAKASMSYQEEAEWMDEDEDEEVEDFSELCEQEQNSVWV